MTSLTQTPKQTVNTKVTESASLVCAFDISADPEETWVAVEVSEWAECALHLEQVWVFHIALCVFCIFPIFLNLILYWAVASQQCCSNFR